MSEALTYQESVALGWVRLEAVRFLHGSAVHARLVAGLVHKQALSMGSHGGLYMAPLDTVAHSVGIVPQGYWDFGVRLAVQSEQDMIARRSHPTCVCEWCTKRREEVARGS